MLNFSYVGLPLTHQKVVPGNVITSLSAYCYKYRLYVLNFDAGTAGNAIADDDWVYGVTSLTKARVRKMVLSGGTWAGNNAYGYCLIDSWDGTAWTDNEKIQVAADATMADVDQVAAIVEATDAQYDAVGMLPYKHKMARFAQVICYANTALISLTGAKPNQTLLAGLPLSAGSGISITDCNAITGFRCVDYVAGTASILQVTFFF